MGAAVIQPLGMRSLYFIRRQDQAHTPVNIQIIRRRGTDAIWRPGCRNVLGGAPAQNRHILRLNSASVRERLLIRATSHP